MVRYIFLAFTILVVCVSSLNAQKPIEAEMIDNFGLLPCDELNSRSWNLVNQISKTPGSRALVVADPKRSDLDRVKALFKFILASFQFREIEDRVDFKIANKYNDGSYEFWKIPPGATGPIDKGETWEVSPPNVSKPFVFGYEDEINECPTFVPRKYAELLLANPGSRSHIVIKSSRSGAQLKGFADDTIKELVGKYKVERNRIRIFYRRSNEFLSYAEYWFVPARLNREKTNRSK
jgi:hypothetical protein